MQWSTIYKTLILAFWALANWAIDMLNTIVTHKANERKQYEDLDLEYHEFVGLGPSNIRRPNGLKEIKHIDKELGK